MRLRLAVTVLLACTASGCALYGPDEAADGGLDRDFAVSAVVVDPTGSAASGPADDASTTNEIGDDDPATSSSLPTTAAPPPSTGAASPTTAPESTPAVTLVDEGDRVGDHGLQAPDWADLVHVTLVDDGAGSLRARVRVAGAIPLRTREREVAGIGVDLYRSGQAESDNQIFLEGAPDGWFAYLDGPSGLVPFPGTFELLSDEFVVTVPWDAIGGHLPGELRVFADWSDASLVVPVQSSDAVPDRGRIAYG